MIDPLFSHIAILFMAAFFFIASVHKLWRIDRFQTSLAAYQLLPDRLTSIAKYLLPVSELLISILLLVPPAQSLAIIASVILLSLYGLAIGINLYRGRTEIDCGCSFQQTPVPLSPYHLLRNGMLMAIVLVPLLPLGNRVLTLIDFVQCLIGAALIGLLYLTVEGLMANSSHRIMEER